MDPQIGTQPSDSSASKIRPMAHEPERSRLRPAFLRRFKPFAPFFALVALSLLTGALNPRFFEFNNVVRIANSAAIPLVLALGETFVIVLGSIDLSVEGVLAVGSVVISLLVRNDSNANSLGWIGAALAIAICAAIGCVNGLIHVNLRIPSFMATLGMWFVGVGMATLILGGSTVRVLDSSIRSLALTRLFVFPLAVWVSLGILGLTWLFERYTRIGRYIYAIGGGEDLAALSGIPVKRVKLIVFTLAGALYGLAGLLAAAQLGLGNAMIGSGRLFFTITAVVVGGSALTGGEGGVLNTFVGVLIIAVLANGMVLLGISPYVQQAVQGLLIIVAVALSIDRARLKIVK
jgi:ribose transport system permease protein